MNRKKKVTWTNEENALLQEYYHKLSLNALLAILPGKTKTQIDKQVWALKRKNKEFQY